MKYDNSSNPSSGFSNNQLVYNGMSHTFCFFSHAPFSSLEFPRYHVSHCYWSTGLLCLADRGGAHHHGENMVFGKVVLPCKGGTCVLLGLGGFK